MFSDNSLYEHNRAEWTRMYSGVQADDLIREFRVHEDAYRRRVASDIGFAGLYTKDFRNRLEGARVLELGFGDGRNALMMLGCGVSNLTAVEINDESEKLLRTAAKELGYESKVTILIGDFTQMVFPPQSFDVIVCKALLHHLTHDQEDAFLRSIATLLVPDGEARFFEPATDSKVLDDIRWLMPMPGRPSVLQKAAFAKFKEEDTHPDRDNSDKHYRAAIERYFTDVDIVPIGGLERFAHRLIRKGPFRERVRAAALKTETILPLRLQSIIARSQTIIAKGPRR